MNYFLIVCRFFAAMSSACASMPIFLICWIQAALSDRKIKPSNLAIKLLKYGVLNG
jgi:hypothetical protein